MNIFARRHSDVNYLEPRMIQRGAGLGSVVLASLLNVFSLLVVELGFLARIPMHLLESAHTHYTMSVLLSGGLFLGVLVFGFFECASAQRFFFRALLIKGIGCILLFGVIWSQPIWISQ
jgi:hypothetical protein